MYFYYLLEVCRVLNFAKIRIIIEMAPKKSGKMRKSAKKGFEVAQKGAELMWEAGTVGCVKERMGWGRAKSVP